MPHSAEYIGRAACPKCRTVSYFGWVELPGPFACPGCGEPLVVAYPRGRWIILSSFFAAWLVAYVTGLRGDHLAYLPYGWLVAFVALLVASNLTGLAATPAIEPAKGSHSLLSSLGLFVGFWVGCSLAGIVYVFSFYGWFIKLVGTPEELREHFEMLSLPLAWANPRLIIRPSMNLAQVWGVIILNSLFPAAILSIVYRVVRALLRRGQPHQLGLANPVPDDDEVP